MAISGIVGFLGFGNMGQAIANGLVAADTLPPSQILAYDIDPDRAANAPGGSAADSPADLAEKSDAIVLAPKPQDMQSALDSIASHIRKDTLIISIAAGISIAFIQAALGQDTHVARVMPNTPALVGAGAAAFALSDSCTEEDAQQTETIFSAIGIAERVPESAMDAVTALSGSGPAYYFAFVEASIKAAVTLGLNEDQATRLASQTFYGAGLLLHESDESAATLRERVTSKGGTTAAALNVFAEQNLDSAVLAAMQAAANRSKELGQ